MPGKIWSPPVRRFSRNLVGRDFICGDLHGVFDHLREALERVGFDRSKDRMFCVGDLVDRGPLSEQSIRLLRQDWFFAARGNHEDMLIECHDFDDPGMAALTYLERQGNGIEWFTALSPERRMDYVEEFRKMPIAMEIETSDGKIGIVHADVPYQTSWEGLKIALEGGHKAILNGCMWSRDRLETGNASGVECIDRVYVGHTVLKQHGVLGNVVAIDTGAVFGWKGKLDGYLTIVDAELSLAALHAVPPQRTPSGRVSAMLSWEIVPVLDQPSAFAQGT